MARGLSLQAWCQPPALPPQVWVKCVYTAETRVSWDKRKHRNGHGSSASSSPVTGEGTCEPRRAKPAPQKFLPCVHTPLQVCAPPFLAPGTPQG